MSEQQKRKAEDFLMRRVNALRFGGVDPELGIGGAGFDGNRPVIFALKPGHSKTDYINVNAAPLEFLIGMGLLAKRSDYPHAASIRRSVGENIRDVIHGSQVSGLKSQNFESTGGGSNNAGAKPLSEYKTACIQELVWLRGKVPTRYFRLLEDVCYRDRWIWREKSAGKHDAVIESIQRAMDRVALEYRYITAKTYRDRWQKRPPKKKAEIA